MKLGLALVRLVLGLFFIGHGTQKLFGWFGGYGPEGTGQFFESLGLRPGKRNAIAAGAAEAGGGVLLTLGLAVPVAAALVTGAMWVAIRKVHAPKGPWASEGGWEYNAVIIAVVFQLADVGPGGLSLDSALDQGMYGLGWALGSLAAGIAGGELLIRASEAPPQPQADQAADGQPAVPATG
jgi:putative oxidoreductase